MIDELKFARVPFQLGGRGIEGADCYGFARLVAADAGVQWPRHNDVSVRNRGAGSRYISGQIEAFWQAIPQGQEHAGDAVHMWSVENGVRLDLHVGVIIRPGRMAHLEEVGGVQFVALSHQSVENRILGIYRFHGQCDDQTISVR